MVTVEVCRPKDLGRAEIERWSAFQAGDPALANPFLSAGFARSAGDARPDARVAVVLDGGQVVGFLAYSAARAGLARSIAPGLCNAQALVCHPALDIPLAPMLSAAGIRLWTFDHLPAAQLLRLRPRPADLHGAADQTWVIDLGGSWAGYVAWARSERRRYIDWLERKRRALERRFHVELVVRRWDDEGVRAMVRMKRDQCRRMGWYDLFADSWVRTLVESLPGHADEAFFPSVATLRVDGSIAAADVSLRSPSCYAGWLISYDRARAQLSPGALRWRYLLERLAGEGVARVDMGRGADEFKVRFATGTAPVVVGAIGTSSMASRAVLAATSATTILEARAPGVDRRIRSGVRWARRVRYRF